jgi:adenosylhomocysteine nucleosidase
MNGIITVFDKELESLKDYSLVEDIRKMAGLKFYLGRLNDQEVVFVKIENGGLGAAAATQAMIDHFPTARIFFTGIAEPIAPFVDDGDLIAANYMVRVFDADNGRPEMYPADEFLLQTIRAICDSPRSGKPPHIFGPIMQRDAAETENPKWKSIRQECGGLACDDAGVAVGFVCARNKIPFAALEIASRESALVKPNSFLDVSIQEAFEIRGLAMIEASIAAITSQL